MKAGPRWSFNFSKTTNGGLWSFAGHLFSSFGTRRVHPAVNDEASTLCCYTDMYAGPSVCASEARCCHPRIAESFATSLKFLRSSQRERATRIRHVSFRLASSPQNPFCLILLLSSFCLSSSWFLDALTGSSRRLTRPLLHEKLRCLDVNCTVGIQRCMVHVLGIRPDVHRLLLTRDENNSFSSRYRFSLKKIKRASEGFFDWTLIALSEMKGPYGFFVKGNLQPGELKG